MKRITFLLLFTVLLLFPTVIFGSSGDLGMEGLKGALATTSYSPNVYNGDVALSRTVSNALNAVFILSGTIFFALIVYGGALWMMAAGNSEQIDKAKQIVIAAAIGGVIVASAYTITYFVMSKIGNSGSGKETGNCTAVVGGSETTLEATQADCSQIGGTWSKN